MKAQLYIGTSGYSYAYWRERFYPAKMPASRWLEYYSTKFNTLEINHTFYKYPVLKTLKQYEMVVPEDFRFTIKMHKIVTHNRRFTDVKQKIREFMDIAEEGLGKKLACVLYQLPPSYTYSEERLNDIVESLDNKNTNVVEFRHAGWWNDKVYKSFRKNKLIFCSASFPGLPEDNIVTGKTFYKRMHGVPVIFQSSYPDKELKKLAKEIPVVSKQFIYFNNTTYEAGYTNALQLATLTPH